MWLGGKIYNKLKLPKKMKGGAPAYSSLDFKAGAPAYSLLDFKGGAPAYSLPDFKGGPPLECSKPDFPFESKSDESNSYELNSDESKSMSPENHHTNHIISLV